MSALAITRVSVQRYLRDRTALFFMVVLPVMVILIVGATVRGFSTFRVGVVDLGAGQAGQEVNTALTKAADLEVHHFTTLAGATTALARGEVSTAVVLPAGMDSALRSGSTVTITVLAEPADSTQQAAATAVRSAIISQGSQVQAALFAVAQASGSLDQDLVRAAAVQPHVPQATVDNRQVDSRASVLPEGFSYSAPTMLVLFVFLNALAGGANIIETGKLGMYERMATTPIRSVTIVAGETLTYVAIALLQSLLIVTVGATAFGVSWGDPLAATALISIWALVGAGAGMLSGTLFRTPEQASAMGPVVGIAFGMLGGCMWPLSIVGSLMRQVGHATPQAWAVDAWTAVLSRSGTLGDIVPDLAVLAGFALAFLSIATFRLRRALA